MAKTTNMNIRKLLLVLLIMPLAFVACGPKGSAELPPPVLTLTSEPIMNFNAAGGQGVITYTLANPDSKIKLSATCEATWITKLVVGKDITFKVEANNTDTQRNANIVISYADKSFSVGVMQFSDEQVVEFSAEQLVGEYIGNQFSATYNIVLYLTDLGFSEDGYSMAGGTYYMLDIYTATKPQLDEQGWLTIPVGTYTLDISDSTADKSIGNEYSAYFKINADGSGYEAEERYDYAELIVTDNGITLTAYINDTKHVATHSSNRVYIGPTLDGGNINATSLVGDYYGTENAKLYNYNIILSDKGYDAEGYPMAGGLYFSLDLYGPEPTILSNGILQIPIGSYYYDKNGTLSRYEVGREHSGCIKVNDDRTAYEFVESFTSVTVDVRVQSIIVECIVAGGEYTVVYQGKPEFYIDTADAQ